jgi:ectoine hydroxylase-related dioxygenase (phytanoyl-CoA dioxygenase family)
VAKRAEGVIAHGLFDAIALRVFAWSSLRGVIYAPGMLIDPGAIAEFQRDGATVLRGVLDGRWIERLADGVERNRLSPSKWAHQYTSPGETSGFWSDYVTWPEVPEYQAVVFDSGLADAARQLMDSTAVRFFHEHVLVKEPGTTERTPWHHDQPYYCVDGDQNVSMWISLDPVPLANALRFIAGSHRWNRWFVPRRFLDHVPYADAQGRFELLPDVEADLGEQRVVSWAVEPGDVICFHYRTLHDAPGTEGLAGRRRAVSLRWIGDDARFALRPWLHSPPFEQQELIEGQPLDDARFPLVAP